MLLPDSVGSADYNYQLSQRRAEAVVQYLAAKFNVPPHKFYLIGIGKDQEVADNKTAAGRAQLAGAPGIDGIVSVMRLRAADNAAGVEAFCRGAGIDVKVFAEDTQSRILHLAGLMMREALVGLKGLALAQREMRDHSQIEVGREDPQQIGLTGLPVEDLLLRLLQGHNAHKLDAVQWLRETLASTRRHDLAFARALRTALAEFLPRLDPKTLAPIAASDALSDRFRSITEMPAGRLPHLFAEAFARVFAAEFKGSSAS